MDPPISPIKEPRAGPLACSFERTKGPTLQETEEGTESSGSPEDYWAIVLATRSTNDLGNSDVAMHIRIIRIFVSVLHLFIGGMDGGPPSSPFPLLEKASGLARSALIGRN